MTEFGKQFILSEDVVFVGDVENPRDNIGFQLWEKALKEVYQPERLNPEDARIKEDVILRDLIFSSQCVCDSPTSENK